MKEVRLSHEEVEDLTNQIKLQMIDALQNASRGDLSDIGNDIGIAVGNLISHKNYFGFHKDDFIAGFKHGISLTDGTH